MDSTVLKQEIERVEGQLKDLEAERQMLSRIPVMAGDADPVVIAEQITSTVAKNAPRLRGLESAIATIEQRLQTQKSQLPQLQQQEAKATAQERVDAALVEMARHCEIINSASELIEREVASLRELAASTAKDRWTVYPYVRSYDFLSEENLGVLNAFVTTIGCTVKLRPIANQ